MLRRLLPAFIALGVALVALTWGLITLQSMFAEENAAALAELETKRAAINARATAELRSQYSSALLSVSRDPLISMQRRLEVRDGKQVFPARPRPSMSPASPIRDAFRFAESRMAPDEARAWLRKDILGDQLSNEQRQRALLERASSLTETDFFFLAQFLLDDAAHDGESSQKFADALRELELGAPLLPTHVSGPTLFRQTWYLSSPNAHDDVGVEAPLDQMLVKVAGILRDEGTITDRDRLSADVEPIQSMAGLRVEADLPAITAAETELARRYRLKNAMVGVCGLLALALTVFGIVGQRRKQRFLDLKSDFVSTVSHELRTPLASIRLLAETLERSGNGAFDETIKQFPGRIVRVADGMNFLVENILSFNQVTKGRWVIDPKSLRLDELIEELRTDLTDASPKPVHLSLTGDSVELFADPALMRLLFVNLGRNAVAYNRQPSVEITVKAEREATGYITVRFSDNGIGIPGDEWENVFQDFYRLKNNDTEVHGSGLGLALCRRILRLHHARITIESSGPRGTVFALAFSPPRPAA